MTRLLCTAGLTTGWLLILPCLFIIGCAVFPVIPLARIYASSVVPNSSTWLAAMTLGAMLIASLVFCLEWSRRAAILVAAAAVSCVFAGAVVVHLLMFARENGARVNLLSSLSTRDFSEGSAPDRTAVYADRGGERLSLDIYLSRDRPAPGGSPVMVAVHGGGFVEGSRRGGAANMRWYADRGWTVISIDYRLASPQRATWDLASSDVECALAWTARNAGRLGIDMRRLVLTGGSAGGSLALKVAWRPAGPYLDPDCGPSLPPIRAVVTKAPLIDFVGAWRLKGEYGDLQRGYLQQYLGGSPDSFPERYAAVASANLLAPSNPPTLIISGANDRLVPPDPAHALARRAAATGMEIRHTVFPYAGHDFNTAYNGLANQAVRQIALNFMNEMTNSAVAVAE